jgi:hypothetical protein
MSQNPCARPGCGHNRRQVNYTISGPPVPEDFGHHLDGCHVVTETPEGWMRCPCPAYRTQAQQEAFGQASEALDKLRRCYWGPYSVEFAEAALERLLELYP